MSEAIIEKIEMSEVDLWDRRHEGEESVIKYNVIDELQGESIETIREIVKRDALPFAVIIYNCNGNLNIGNIIRTTMVFGGIDVWIVGRRKLDIRSAVGAHHYINLRRIPEIPHPVGEFFRREKMFPVLIE
jgi:tRNA G18 (ribose-2'-O)-methylase SpoU